MILADLKNKKGLKEEDLIDECQQIINAIYPALKVRWAKIYGKRWAFIQGNQGELSLYSERYQLSPSIGIILDNPDIISLEDKAKLLASLKECFNDYTG